MIDMRNIASAFLGCFTILAACSNSDDTEKPVALVSAEDVTIYATTSSLTRDLTRDTVDFNSRDGLAPTSITLSPTEQYQTMNSFGTAIADATCSDLLQIKLEDRHAFLTETFSDGKGFGFSYIRISIGCPDFSLSEYTCCDTKGIEHFALQSEEKDYILPILREILSINPPIKVIAAPWTYPEWTKVKNLTDLTSLDSWTNGQLSPAYYQDCVTYFMEWVQTFNVEGIDIYATTLRSEPLNRGNFAPLYISWGKQRDLVKTAPGPKFKTVGLATKIYAYGHNYGYSDIAAEKNYPGKMYEDAATSQYLAGAAYHNYGGNHKELLGIHKAYPEKELLFTKTPIGTWSSGCDLSKRLPEDVKEIALGTTNNWCRGVMVWNLMLDSDHAPNREGGYRTCYGAMDTNSSDYKTIIHNSHYYIIIHLPSVMKPGAIRIGASGYADSNIIYSAFENPDGVHAFVLMNSNEKTKKITLSGSKRHFACDIPSKSVTSYRWAESE